MPGIVERLKFVEDLLSFPIISLSHQLSVATGFILLGLSRGIEYRVKSAYHLTIVVLSFAALFSLFKGFDYEEAIVLLVCSFTLTNVQVPILSRKLCFDMERNHF